MTVEPWSIEGKYIYRHHVEPRVKLCVPKEESFQMPLKYIEIEKRAKMDTGEGKSAKSVASHPSPFGPPLFLGLGLLPLCSHRWSAGTSES